MDLNIGTRVVFDDRLLRRTKDRMTGRALGKIGALLRKVAQRSLRYRNKPSRPGHPPHVHRRTSFTRVHKKKSGASVSRPTSPFRELLFFALDKRADSVVTGPAIFQNRRTKSYKVPTILEGGGTVYRRVAGKATPVRIEARPTMGPAMKVSKNKFAATFAGQFRK